MYIIAASPPPLGALLALAFQLLDVALEIGSSRSEPFESALDLFVQESADRRSSFDSFMRDRPAAQTSRAGFA
jgi:hypothetical protein